MISGKLCIHISLLVVYYIIFRCDVFKCNLNLWYFGVIFFYTLYILVIWCIVVIYNEMFFCMRSILSCSQTIGRFRTVWVGLATDSDRAKFLLVTVGIRALVYKAQRTRHIRTIRKNSLEIGLVISNRNDSLEMGSVVS